VSTILLARVVIDRPTTMRLVLGAIPTSSGGGSSDHATLTNLAWTLSGHTGAVDHLAGFNSAGDAEEVVLSVFARNFIAQTTEADARTAIGAQAATDLLTSLSDLDGAGSGLVVTSGGAAYQRSIAVNSGLLVSNASGVAGNPTISLGTALAALAAGNLSASLSGGSTYTLTNLPTPSAATDAATKGYVDALANGLDWKGSCRLATAAALPAYTGSSGTLTASANGALTVDGVAVAVADSILVKNEGSARNGVYTVSAAGSAGTPWVLVRRTDADASAEVTSGLSVFVVAGSTNASTGWVLTTADPIVLETTVLAFSQNTGMLSVLPGDGLSLSGSVLAVNVDGSSIETSADTLRIKAAGVTLAKMANLAALSVIGNATNGSATPTAITAANDGEVLRRSGTALGFGTIATAAIADATATPTASKIPIADGSGKLDGWITAASTSASGIVELATPAEAVAGTSTTLAATPAGLTAAIESRLVAAQFGGVLTGI